MAPPQVAALPPRVAVAIDRPPQWTGVELVGSAVVEFVVTAVVIGFICAAVSAVSPEFTDDGLEYLRAEPGEAFLYGLVAYVVSAVAMLLLAITVIGLVIVIPAAIVIGILSLGGTAVSVIALGTWIRSTLGSGTPKDRGTALVVGAVAWAGLGLVPVLGGIVTFVVGTMGFGYLALWVTNGRFDRDYGSLDGDGYGGPGGSTRGPDVLDSGSTGGESSSDDSDRFRNIAAVDAEREAEGRKRAGDDDATDTPDSDGRER
ncbi:hypothetical protein [Halorubrum sp. CSM-61]|uniref:hypothetical protein n=1 Tax=Halorubrum sp. CSM-61 TaxID=2485838 RepID=UPI000F4C808F|nr:hypothetical protein [Halorubrum sp. CSM-61]